MPLAGVAHKAHHTFTSMALLFEETLLEKAFVEIRLALFLVR